MIPYADDTAIITSNSNLNIAQKQASEMFTKLYHWRVANKFSINSDKTNFALFHIGKTVPKHFECIQTDVMQINRVNSAQYLGMLLDEYLYWHEYVDQICASLVKYVGIIDHIKKCFLAKIKAAVLCFYLFSNTVRYRSIWIIHERKSCRIKY